jgi:hypothetical protein
VLALPVYVLVRRLLAPFLVEGRRRRSPFASAGISPLSRS